MIEVDGTLRIKNLSIALEALSHVRGSTVFSYNIEKLLEQEILEEKERKEKEKQWPHQGSAKPTPDDDIPF